MASKTRTRPPVQVRLSPLRSLRPNPGNPRRHSKTQIQQIAKSIQEFGFCSPILLDAEEQVVAGHGRLEAARLLGLSRVPTIRLDHLTKEQARAYLIADNRLAEKSEWDREALAAELSYLTSISLDFDLTTTGFSTAEIDLMLEGPEDDASDSSDDVPEPGPPGRAVSQLGDLWRLGKHRLLCGDATDPASFARLLGRQRAEMVFVDLPYNVPISGHVCGSGRIRHREFAMASGEMSPDQFAAFLEESLDLLARASQDGAILFACMDWRHLWEMSSAARRLDLELKNLVVWQKDNAGMGSLYRSQHELLFVLKNGQRPHINNVALGKFGRNRSNVWTYAGANSLRKGKREQLAMHPTVKPVALVASAISDCSNRGGIVLDSFAGSGTTIIAAERTGRIGYAMEIDPVYVDVALSRFERLTGTEAVLESTGQSYGGVACARNQHP